MKIPLLLFLLCLISVNVVSYAFSPPLVSSATVRRSMLANDHNMPRSDFISGATNSAAMALLLTNLLPGPASARGRATLEQAYDRYTPRIISGGNFYNNELKKMIASSDFAGIKKATSDPPAKSKADRSKIDGGVSERAALAGEFSNAKILVAADLFAATFSDNSISSKTKKMRGHVEKLKDIVAEMNSLSKQALGEDSSGSGLFGLGGKKLSQSDISKKLRQLYGEGGQEWNAYIFASNDELPLNLKKLPYLK